ncbi:hypothetical protein BJY52DRAFT_233806 [Lactarius psammicola]|nr:hypothetical protein BJY52DRAFT_233806 [Lactarius psammicola]
MVIEVVTRAPEGVGRNLERELLDVGKTTSEQLTPHLPFNLNLTPEQQQSRASVPLPYAHKGELDRHAPQSFGSYPV